MKWIFICLLYIPVVVKGQVNQVWIDANLQHKMNNRWSWAGDFGARFTLKQSLSVAFIRGAILYHASPKLTLYGGFGYFFYNSSPSGITGHELRPWQGARFDFNLSPKIILTNYTRLEERSINGEGENEFFLRFRNLTGVTVTVFQNNTRQHSIYIPVSFEFFEDLNKKMFINRHRTYFGAGYAFLKNRIEIHYILQQGRLNSSDGFELTENIYRIRWFRTL